MNSLLPAYTDGTHRLVSPEQTLADITPHLPEIGITRCADVTGLDDDLGVPTYCAIRPRALVWQTSNGKGLTRVAAQVSSLMEAIELHHAENPEPERLRRSCASELSGKKGLKVARPEELPHYYNQFFSDTYKVDWIEGENLVSHEKIWAPASAVYFGCEPSLFYLTTNGLASGNHITEATLHALYELIERDAVSNISSNGSLKIKEKCKIIDTKTITNKTLRNIVDRIEKAGSKMVLLWTKSCIPIHTFWAILLNKSPFSAMSTVNPGFGTHFNLDVAGARAITETVQSRLSMIQGSREDIAIKSVAGKEDVQSSPAFKYLDNLESDTDWNELDAEVDFKNNDLFESYNYLIKALAGAGHNQIMLFDLTKPKFKIPVVKVLAPSLKFNPRLF